MANHGHPATPTAPVTPSPPQWQPLKWSFPFAPKSGNAADPQTWLNALAGADGGFYPLGANGMFHGGNHFDMGTGRDLKQGDGVKVIADGEVVAYRLDSSYPELTYPTTPPHYALYSTSFVLVRHKLVLPPATASGMPAMSSAPSQEYQPPADDVLEFYSLYMHQLDWAGYKDAQTGGNAQSSASSIRPLPFWQGERHFSVGTKANDHQAQAPKLNTPFRFDLDSAATYAPQLESIAAGPSTDSLAGLSPRGDSKVRHSLPLSEAGNGADAPESAQGARILDRLNGTVNGLLPRGSELRVAGNATSGWAQIAGIVKGAPVATVAGGPPDARAATGWINLDELDAVIDPQPLDTVVVLDKPFKVNAGDVVGYLGEYTNSSQAQKLPPKPTRPLLHVEVFTGAPIDAFIGKSRERATKLPDSGKMLLVIEQGAKFVNPDDPQSRTPPVGATLVLAKGDPGKGNWAKVQPTIYPQQSSAHGQDHHDQSRGTPVGNAVWIERRDVGKAYSSVILTWPIFPLQIGNAQGSGTGYQLVLSRAQLDQVQNASRATDDQGTQWWAVTAGDGDGKTISGWVCEKNHPNTQWQSPWSWPGFDTVDTTSVPLLDMYRRTLFEKKQLLDGEEQEFSVVAAKVNAGMLIAKLEMAAKRQGDGKGNVVPADLKRALTVRWLAQAVSHLIFRYESEWGGDMSKWDKLSSIMGEGKSIWQTELQRIEKLQWWNQVKAVKGFPADPDVWHVHPIGLVGNFARSATHPFVTILGQRVELQFLQKASGTSLTEQDYADAAAELGCEARAIKAVAKTETGSSGPYFRPGRDLAGTDDPVPAILFERHLFHRATQGRYDQSHPRISNPSQGGYGAKSIQYEKLMEAYILDPDAALRSASWGRFQILGSNFKATGFQSAHEYVASVSESEANQLRAFVSFIKADQVLRRAICNKDWHSFAKRYNGPAQQGYDTTIARNYEEVNGA